MALSKEELELLQEHRQLLTKNAAADEKNLAYYRGKQKIEQLGLAIPEPARKFLVIANWCRVLVDTKDDRMQVRSLFLPGAETTDDRMTEIVAASRLATQVSLNNKDRQIYGRSFFTIGKTREDGPTVIRADSPRQMTTIIDTATELETSAARNFKVGTTQKAVLYLPDQTIYTYQDKGGWVEDYRDHHNLGVVPVVTHLNRRLAGEWEGESELTDLIPLVDAVARALTNLQFAQESNGAPHKWIAGTSKEEMLNLPNGKRGRMRPVLDAYFNAITFLKDPSSKMGQLPAADLKNFSEVLTDYGKQAAVLTGLPVHYWGVTAANPSSEGAIIADESQFVRDVESDNMLLGDTLGRAAQIAWRDHTGEQLDLPVSVEWFDVSTPTVAQREDALMKRRSNGALSREGYWDELGWSEARKRREREYLEKERAESIEPTLANFGRDIAMRPFSVEPDKNELGKAA